MLLREDPSALLALFGGCLLDPLNNSFDPRAALLRRQVLPTGQRRESHRVRRRELARADRLAAVPCRVFLVQSLCPAEDAEDDLIEIETRDEEETRLDRAVRDLDEDAPLQDEADAPGHGRNRRDQGTCQPAGVAGSSWKNEAQEEA